MGVGLATSAVCQAPCTATYSSPDRRVRGQGIRIKPLRCALSYLQCPFNFSSSFNLVSRETKIQLLGYLPSSRKMASRKALTYSEYVRIVSMEHRGLAMLSDLLNVERPSSPSHVTAIDYLRRGGTATLATSTNQEYAPLVTIPPEIYGRIIIVEDINTSLIEVLGSKFDIDPLFFASHIAPSPKSAIDKVHAATWARLPSQLVRGSHLHLLQKRVLDFGEIYAYENELHDRYFKTVTNVPRSVHLLPYSSGKKQLGIAHAYCSLALKRTDNSWICTFYSNTVFK
jgi:hypothetical protein